MGGEGALDHAAERAHRSGRLSERSLVADRAGVRVRESESAPPDTFKNV